MRKLPSEKRMIQPWRRCVCFFGILSMIPFTALINCGGTRVVHVETDPSFTYETAGSGALTVIGVTSAVGGDDFRHEVREVLPRLLAERIAKKRSDLPILDPRRVEESFGSERLGELLDRYEVTGRLDTSDVIGLFDATHGLARFVVLARIELDSVARTVEKDEISADHKTERFLRIGFRVYDISTADLVFDGAIEANDFDYQIDAVPGEREDECSSILACAACLFDFLSWFEDKDEEGFPPPPKLEGLAKSVFDKFAEQLPKPGSG